MFTRKPLGGNSCASCEKNITNLQGKMAEYFPWQKFPFRDPNERIARVGQGFSRMLSMLKPESMTRFEKMGSHFEGEGIPEEGDPRLQTMHSPSEQHQLYTYHQHQHAPIEIRQGMTSPLQPLSTTAA